MKGATDPHVTGFLKLPDLLDMMSRYFIFSKLIIEKCCNCNIVVCRLQSAVQYSMVVYRMIMERNYDAQIEDAFRCFDKKGLGTIPRQDFELLFEVRIFTIL